MATYRVALLAAVCAVASDALQATGPKLASRARLRAANDAADDDAAGEPPKDAVEYVFGKPGEFERDMALLGTNPRRLLLFGSPALGRRRVRLRGQVPASVAGRPGRLRRAHPEPGAGARDGPVRGRLHQGRAEPEGPRGRRGLWPRRGHVRGEPQRLLRGGPGRVARGARRVARRRRAAPARRV